MSFINTENFPDISFIGNETIDGLVTQMINDYLDKYEEITGERIALAQADPNRLILYACANQIYQAMQYADHAGKMSFLTYSMGDFLDNLAALRGTNRKQATPAKAQFQFSIDSALATAIAIPAGTRITNGNDVFFATDEYAEISIGETSVTVGATCTTAGAEGNGFAPGEFTTLVNTIPYITAVTNTEETYGGAPTESDEDLKERIYKAPGSYSTTGPNDAYIYHTKNVSPQIGDVYVDSTNPGEVDVYFVMEDGSIPSASMIAQVQSALNTRTIRPLTDYVVVQAPTAQTYDIDVTYYISASDTAAVSTIQENVTAAIAAFNDWQTEIIGRDINPSQLVQKLMEAGVKRVVVKDPVYTVMGANKIAQPGTITVNYGGIEND